MPEITDDPPTLDDVIRSYVIRTCVACGWNLNRTARVLRVAVKTVYNHLHRYEEQGFIERGPRNIGWRVKEQKGAG